MAHIYVLKLKNGWDISVHEIQLVKGLELVKLLKTAWANTKTDALRKAAIFADFYTDDNGQRADIKFLGDKS